MIPTSLLGRDCFRGRRHRRHGHNVFGPRRRREGHLERRERVAFDAQQEASVAAERVDEGRLGVRRRDFGAISARRRNSRSHSCAARLTQTASEATASTCSSAGVTCRDGTGGFGNFFSTASSFFGGEGASGGASSMFDVPDVA